MDRNAYLRALYDALTELVPAQERAEILRYYEEYFDDAGPEGEASVIESLGDPRELARKLAAEAGYDAPAAKPAPVKRGPKWYWVLLGIVAVLTVMIVALAALFKVVDKVVDGDFPNVTTTQPTEEVGDPLSLTRIEISEEPFSLIEIEAPVADVTIRTGEGYYVELEWMDDGQYGLKYSLSGGTLRITGIPDSVSGNSYARVNITVPEGAVLRETDIEIGVGNVTIENAALSDLSCETGVGDIAWRGPLARETELNTGVGDITITTDTIDGWRCELSVGAGEVLVNGAEHSFRFRQGGTAGKLEAEAGVGSIVLTTG